MWLLTAYNWGLTTCITEYELTKKRPSAVTLHKRLVAEVKSQNPWYYEVSKCPPQQALRDLDIAFKNFLTIPKRGFPKFKKKGKKDSFSARRKYQNYSRKLYKTTKNRNSKNL